MKKTTALLKSMAAMRKQQQRMNFAAVAFATPWRADPLIVYNSSRDTCRQCSREVAVT
jgi:hypothetical protein